MRSSYLIPLAAALGLGLSLPALITTAQADGKASRPDVISVKDIKKGMKGYGLTVFEGTKPERFEVEVIDVLSNFKPRQELILVKTIHPRLEIAKIVGGMSGSPIFLNGKMAGAYAYGWTFGVEPVAGVTPIRSMLDDLERPLPKMLHGLPLGAMPSGAKVASTSGRYSGKIEEYSLKAHAEQMAARSDFSFGSSRRSSSEWDSQDSAEHRKSSPSPGGSQSTWASRLTPVATPLLMGGMSAETIELAEEFLSPLGLLPIQAGGSGSQNQTAEGTGYVDGGAIGVNLVNGDISAMGLGTVTRVEGDKLVAFGHPMMEVGVTSLPTTEARVLWFMASQMRSFKMGEATHSLGSLVNDRQSSIVVHENVKAPVVEVALKIIGEPGAPYAEWNFELAHDRFLTPSLLALAIGNGLTTTAAERRDVTWSMKTELDFEGYPPIEIDDVGASPTGTPTGSAVMQTEAMKAVGMVINNPWQYARLSKVNMEMRISFGREVAQLRGVQLLTPEVDPGGNARVRLTLEPFDGATMTRVVSVPIPKEFAGQQLTLEIQPGYAVEPVRAAPENLAELISNLEAGTEEPRSVVFSYKSGQGGAAYRGVVAKDLPPAALDRLSNTSSSITPQQFQVVRHHVVKTPLYLVGTDSVTVSVRENRK